MKQLKAMNWQEDLFHVKLFDATIHDYESKEILTLQVRFREWSEMNIIEKNLTKFVIRKMIQNKKKL